MMKGNDWIVAGALGLWAIWCCYDLASVIPLLPPLPHDAHAIIEWSEAAGETIRLLGGWALRAVALLALALLAAAATQLPRRAPELVRILPNGPRAVRVAHMLVFYVAALVLFAR